MSEVQVTAALRSSSRLVVVEAPAGCGKTFQGAEYARELRNVRGRVLISTHTHAACDVFGERTRGVGSSVEIRTIDSLICQIAGMYHEVLDLPADAGAWARSHKNGYHQLAQKVSKLLSASPIIAQSLAERYHTIICDEHQDASAEQHMLAMACHKQGASLRIFGDPMQRIYGRKNKAEHEEDSRRWETLKQTADSFVELDEPHRWLPESRALGEWILDGRCSLRNGDPINLRGKLPPGVSVIFAENTSKKPRGYHLDSEAALLLRELIRKMKSILMLTAENDTVDSLRGLFWLPIWEGHIRNGLSSLIDEVQKHKGDPNKVGEAVVNFIEFVATGFSKSSYSNFLLNEIRANCIAPLRGKRSKLQALGRLILNQADHKGVAGLLQTLGEFMKADKDFSPVRLDYCREFWDAIKMGQFDDPQEAFSELARRRSCARLKPPDKAISTIHKAKGLEFGNVVIIPCDSRHFPDTVPKRCLLYVAMSRAEQSLTFVLSRSDPSPLFQV